jgi:glutamate synthase (NADPH/NADH) large chain
MHCHTVALKHPVLNSKELEKIRSIDTGIFQAKTLQTYFRADGHPDSLKNGLDVCAAMQKMQCMMDLKC